jgi:hypothetical protein
MAEVTPEELAAELAGLAAEHESKARPSDRGTVAAFHRGVAAGLTNASGRIRYYLAPAHAALTAENEQLRQQAADFAHGAGIWVRDRITEATAALEAELHAARQAHAALAAERDEAVKRLAREDADFDARVAELDSVIAERDCYRAALEAIAGQHQLGRSVAMNIAREALEGGHA